MVYQWKLPGLYPVDANVAGNELKRIHKRNGKLEAKDVVNESRPVNAPLHGCFEWNDQIAAEKFREHQAGAIIRAIVVVKNESKQKEPVTVRAFVNTSEEYQPIEIVMSNEKMREEMMKSAKREMDVFRKKYKDLEELTPILEAIDQVMLKEVG